MNKLDANPLALSISTALFPDLRPVRRLIVLVPESETGSAIAARKIWELANVLESDVQFIGLCRDEASEPSLRRQLIFLSTMVADGDVSVESKIEFGNNWLKTVRSNWHTGDVIVCFTGQSSGLMRRPLNKIIEANLDATVYVLDDVYEITPVRLTWLSTVFAWTGSLSIMAGFFLVQAKLTHASADWAYSALMYLSIPVEVGLIWVWNAIFS